jgi:hypothetical protein
MIPVSSCSANPIILLDKFFRMITPRLARFGEFDLLC